MNTENNTAKTPVNDNELADVTGGFNFASDASTGKYYQWYGTDSQEDLKYACPNCKRPVHSGLWRKFYCDPCNASWFQQDKLLPNIGGGLWHEISKNDYDRLS